MAIKFTPQELALLKQKAQQPDISQPNPAEVEALRQRAGHLGGFQDIFEADPGTVLGNFQRGAQMALGTAGTNLLQDFHIHVHGPHIPGYDPAAISTKIGGAVGTVLPYLAVPEAGAAELGAGLLRGIPAAGRLLGQATAYGGTAAALAPPGQKTEAAIGGAVAAPIAAGVGGVSRGLLKAITAMTPKQHMAHIFRLLSQPVSANYKDIVLTEGRKGLEKLSGVDRNQTAAAKLLRNQFDNQGEIAKKNYETDVLNPVENMGLGNSLNAQSFNPAAQEAMDEGLFSKTAKLKKIGFKVQSLLNQKVSPMFGKAGFNQSVRDSHELQSDLGRLGVKYIKAPDADTNDYGTQLLQLRKNLKNDLFNHLDKINSPTVPGRTIGGLYQDASDHYLANVIPYHNIDDDIMSGKDTNPKNFSKYFAHPNLNLLDEQTSMLNIPAQFGNKELERRIVLDSVQDAKNPKDLVSAYEKLGDKAKGLGEYSKTLGPVNMHMDALDNKNKGLPIGRVFGAPAALVGAGMGVEHFLGTTPGLIALAGLSTAGPLARRVLPPIGEAAQRLARTQLARKIAAAPGKKVSKSLLSAALANITGDNQ